MNRDRLKELWEQSTDKYGDAKKMGRTYDAKTSVMTNKCSLQI